jgi:hypothetical protein
MEAIILDEATFRMFFDIASRDAQAAANALVDLMVEPQPLRGTDEAPDGLTPGDRIRNRTLLAAACEIVVRDVAIQDLQGVLAVTAVRLEALADATTAHPDFKPLYQARQALTFLRDHFPNSEMPDVIGRVRRLRRAEQVAQQEDAQNAASGAQVTPSGIITTH